jgi:pimeloyl-ACP methyl ester carboxylesterase
MVVKTLRSFPGKGIELPGVELRPNSFLPVRNHKAVPNRPQGAIYFVHGISACWQDYLPLLEPLAENYRVFAYNQRGHADAPGSFDVEKAANDLEHMIVAEPKKNVGILGHSLGGLAALVAKRLENTETPVKGVFLIEPYLGMEFLHWPQRYAINMLRALAPVFKPVDYVLNALLCLRKRMGMHQRDVLASYAELSRVKCSDVEGMKTPVAFMLANRDEVLGTRNREHYSACVRRIKELFPQVKNYSGLVSGLNHCLNERLFDFVPFLKEDGSVQREANRYQIISYIDNFFDIAFSES